MAADANQEFSFTVELGDKTISGTYGDLTFNAGKATFTLKGGETKTATGLPVGVTYTVAETEDNSFTTTKTGDTGTISETESKATFTNTRETGAVVIKKSFLYNGAPDTTVNEKKIKVGLFSDANAATAVMDTSGNAMVTEITMNADGTGSATFSELAFGTYYVYELDSSDAAVTGSSATINGVTYTVSQDKTNVTLSRENKTGSVEITNSQSELGSIKAVKTLKYNGEVDTVSSGKSFRVGISTTANPASIASNDIKTINLTNGIGEASFTDLIVGQTYYIYEVDGDGKPVGNDFDYEVSGSGTSKTIEREVLNYQVDITNNLTETGSIKVKKTVQSNGVTDPSADNLTFRVGVSTEPVTGDAKLRETDIKTITVKDGKGEVVFDNLTVGETYYVYELDADGRPVGKEFAYSVTGSGTSKTIERNALNQEVEITNNKIETGSIKVVKTLKCNGEIDTKSTDKSFRIGISKTANPESISSSDIKTIAVKNGVGEALFDGLTVGDTYYIYEVDANGKPVGKDYEYAVEGSGSSKTIERETLNYQVDIVNSQVEIRIKKVDIVDSTELEGAKLQILDKDGQVVATATGEKCEWTSTKQPKTIKGLTAGTTYRLHEVVAPSGYAITADTTFSINADGTINKGTTMVDKEGVLLVQDTHKPIKITKVDATTQKELPGATIVLKDSKGNVVDTWKSSGKPHEVTNVKNGETYTLTETVAPNGYSVTTDTKFKINEKGEVVPITSRVREDGVILVEDERIYVTVSKRQFNSSTNEKSDLLVVNALLRILDANGKVAKDIETGKDAVWTTTNADHKVNLAPGKYTLEELATPKTHDTANANRMSRFYSEKVADPITFTVNNNGTVSGGVVVMYDSFDRKSYTEWEENEQQKTQQTVTPTPIQEEDETPTKKAKKTPTPTPTEKVTETATRTPSRTDESSDTPRRTNSVQTGDNQNTAIPIAASALALLVIAFILIENKRRRKA